MGIDKIAKVLKSCNKKMGKNLTISVVVGFLLSCAVAMGTETGTKVETKTKAKITIEGKNNNYNIEKNLNITSLSSNSINSINFSITSFDDFLKKLENEIFEKGDLSKEGNGLKLTISYSKDDKKITINYNGNTQEIDLTLLSENQKAYNLLFEGLESFGKIDENNILTNTQIIDKFGINNDTIFVNGSYSSGQNINNGIGINTGNIFSYGSNSYGQYIDNGIGINTGNIFSYGSNSSGQYIDNGIGINNGDIFSSGPNNYVYYAQRINNGIGINNGNIFAYGSDPRGQEISGGIGINSGNILSYSSVSNSSIFSGQKINSRAIGINTGNIFTSGSDPRGQDISGIGINSGIIFSCGDSSQPSGQNIFSFSSYDEGVGINSGLIYSNGTGQNINTIGTATAINNGIIIANTAYKGNGTFYKNGIALKRDDNNNLILNSENDYNSQVNILDKTYFDSGIGNSFENIVNDLRGKTQGDKKPKNLFINNLGNDSSNDKNNQLILDKNLIDYDKDKPDNVDDYSNTHITTAVTENGKLTEGKAVVKVDNGSDKFSMDKSTIVGYFETDGTLVDMSKSQNVTLSDSVISAFAGDKHSGFDDENNSVNVTAVKFGTGTNVTLNNSTITGKMDFSAGGNNTLNLNGEDNREVSSGTLKKDKYKDGTLYGTYVSEVDFGSGNDEIHIKFGEKGQEKYTSNYDKSGVVGIGDINFGDGKDTLTFSFDEFKKGNFYITGTVDFGKDEAEDSINFVSELNMKKWFSTDTDNDNDINIAKNIVMLNYLLENTENLDTLQLANEENYFVFETVNDKGETVSLNFTGTVKGGSGADTFVVNSELKVTEIDGGTGTNKFIIGDTNLKNTEVSLSGKISNFENVDVNKNIKLGTNVEFNNVASNRIDLKNNNLTLDIDYSQMADGKVTGHALFDKNQDMKFTNVNEFIIDVSEVTDINQKYTISHGDYNFKDIKDEVIGNSANHKVSYSSDGDILINIQEDIPVGPEGEALTPNYNSLNKIYHSILSANKLKAMENSYLLNDGKTKYEAIKAQLEYYGKIYHSSPYSYSNEVSKKSAELITNSLLENRVMADLNKWSFGGSIAGREADNSTNYYGQNLHKVDIGKNEVSAESNIYGAYAFGEYGVSENNSIGFAIAGTNGTTDISGGSKLESNAVFVSAYVKQNLGNLSLMAGLGYQHSFYDSTRVTSNDYQSTTVDKKYEDDLFTIFAGARYIYNLGNGFSLEPNAKLNISHVMQNDIDENDSKDDITIEVDSQDFTSIDTEIGVDIVKKINTEKGKLSFKAGVSLVYALEGYEDEFLNARVVGATKDFEIISPESDRARVKFNVGTEYELENGMFYNLHGNYTTSSHDTDYSVSFGAGYKF